MFDIIMAMPQEQRADAIAAIQVLHALGLFQALAQQELTVAANQLTSMLESDSATKLAFMDSAGMRIRVYQGLANESRQIVAQTTDSTENGND